MESERIIKTRRMGWVSWILLILFFIGIPSFVHADITDILLKFHPYITAEEEYSNNIFLTPNQIKEEDYITRLLGGVRFSQLQAGTYGIDLDAGGGYNYYAKHDENSYWSALGRLNSWYAVTPKLTFRLRDYFVRSDAAREDQYQNLYNDQGQYIGDTQPDQYLSSTQRGVQAIYNRNVVEPSVEYRFGRENLVSLLYRNNIYKNENPLYEDSIENSISPLLNYWFNMKNGITLEYILTYGHFEVSDDMVTNEARTRYTHRIDPKLSFFGEYTFIREHFKGLTDDYDIHTPSLGVEYKFSPTLTGTAQGGYYWQLSDDDSTNRGPFFDVRLVQTAQKTSFTLAVQGGYDRDYFTAENLGFEKYYRGYGTINYKLTPRMDVRVTGSGERVWYSATDDTSDFGNRKDWIWDGRITASYMFFRWLTVALEGGYRECRSTVEDNDYTEYSAIFRVTATFN